MDTQTTAGLDLSKWRDSLLATLYRRVIGKAERMIKVYDHEETAELTSTLNELKKGIVLAWENLILSALCLIAIKLPEWSSINSASARTQSSDR